MPFNISAERARIIKTGRAYLAEHGKNWWDEDVPNEHRIVPAAGPVGVTPDGEHMGPYGIDNVGIMAAIVRWQLSVICNPDGSSKVAEMSDDELRAFWEAIPLTSGGESYLCGVILPRALDDAFEQVLAIAAEHDYWATAAA